MGNNAWHHSRRTGTGIPFDMELPLEQAVDAMRLLENCEVVGKTVVTMNGYSM